MTKFSNALGSRGKDKLGHLPDHETKTYHQNAVADAEICLSNSENIQNRVDVQLMQQKKALYEKNTSALRSIIDCMIFLGKHALAFRGHRDDSTVEEGHNQGNLKALIQFRAKTDEKLREFLNSCPKNANYTSKTIQNEVLAIIGDKIRESVTDQINDETCPYYTIIADELTDDVANKSVLSLCLRYLKCQDGKYSIEEGLVKFSYLKGGNAASIAETIKQDLKDCGLNPLNIRGQAYDTTSAMSSGNNGLQGIIKRDVPNALCTPCNSHRLNLVIASASKLQQIRNCITVVNGCFLFLDASHKRQEFLVRIIDLLAAREGTGGKVKLMQHKLKGLSKTRWVERFEAIDNFIDLSESVPIARYIMVNPHLYRDDEEICALIDEKWAWDADTKTKAQGIKCR
ncbi:hypothetical protein SNE40_023058 [Patella caerulea]|uniref:DUF4371 domain-containing protein n=1 Tax=Patella caerulea TaxID=87958 RepID=A0AAN8J029_PATCE